MTPKRSALIVGSTSVISQEIAKILAKRNYEIILAGRNQEEMEFVANDLSIRYGIETSNYRLNSLESESIEDTARSIVGEKMPQLIIFAIGDPGQGASDLSDANALHSLTDVNYTSIAMFIGAVLAEPTSSQIEQIGFISSVAGDRGRKTNFVYGAPKAALNTFAQGIRGYLDNQGTSVTTIKLGYVDTRLAYGKSPKILTCSPHYAAKTICQAVVSGRNIVYVPWFWRWIMLMIRLIPESIFKKMTLP